MALLRIDSATKRFGGLIANCNVSIEIEKGTIAGLIGPNGAGKSTLFKSINGFNRIDEGEIYFKEIPISKKETHVVGRMGIACTFQHAQLFSNMTLEESILVGAYCHEHKKIKALEIAHEKIEFVGLHAKKDYFINKLNMFERKKAELAAALATNPELLLLDELFAGLVPTEVELMLQLVYKVNKEFGITIFIVEHVLKVIMQLCSKIFVLEYGKLIASGNAQQITQNPEVIKAYLGEDYDAATDQKS